MVLGVYLQIHLFRFRVSELSVRLAVNLVCNLLLQRTVGHISVDWGYRGAPLVQNETILINLNLHLYDSSLLWGRAQETRELLTNRSALRVLLF